MPSERLEDGHCRYDEANELLLNDQFDAAATLFSEEIQKDKTNSLSRLYNCYIGRAQAYLKLKNFKMAQDDSEKAMEIDKTDSRAFHKKGLALYNLGELKAALQVLQEGSELAETPTKKSLFSEWIDKCKDALSVDKVDTDVKEEEFKAVVATPPAVKYQWFQSESQVTVTIMAKNQTSDDVKIESTQDKLIVKSLNPEKIQIDFDFNLEYTVIPDQTQIKFMPTKIEIKLRKSEGLQWRVFNISSVELSNRLAKAVIDSRPCYPSSSKKQKNWDALAKEVDAEEEKLEGDAALNKLFRDVYANGTDETRKAMNKSFTESGGTTLSTNWSDVGSKKLDVKPPDGMEWKKY